MSERVQMFVVRRGHGPLGSVLPKPEGTFQVTIGDDVLFVDQDAAKELRDALTALLRKYPVRLT